ncbi:hypothetical protein F7725_005133 [Dissostichus mawsoni]|uniref:Uncharacterized protein n=1 Tax=Dissostichus mawsoni TaxID=36200 RepID=A0A7J5YUE5_DISMA|nr:hypothetical protein F7725_005133 [Dissostichus mawsoni]
MFMRGKRVRFSLWIMPEVPSGAAEMSRKRVAEPGPLPENVPERKKACWGILTSQGSWADRSPLHEAASQGRLLALRTLLAQARNVACVRALINANANVNAATIDGVTPLYNCCVSGSVGCMELLLQNGAHTQTSHTHFPSALHEACKRGNTTCVESLLSHGADPDYERSHLGSPLYISCLHGHTACSKVLLQSGQEGDSPLHAAVRQDSTDQVSLLLDYGADVNIRDSNHQRPVEIAPTAGKTQQLLLTFEGIATSSTALLEESLPVVSSSDQEPDWTIQTEAAPPLPLPPLLTHYLEYT